MNCSYKYYFSIKVASHLKKEVDKNEKQLLKDIETLESDNDLLTANLQLILDKKKITGNP